MNKFFGALCAFLFASSVAFAQSVAPPPGQRLYVDLATYGVSTNFSTDNTARVNQALNDAVTLGKPLWVGAVYTVNGVLLPSNVHVVCANRQTAGFNQLSAGTGGAQASTVALADPTTTTGVWFENCLINGNKTNVTGPVAGLTVSNAGATGGGAFIPRHYFRNVYIRNTSGDGLVIGATTRDSMFDEFVIYAADGHGLNDGGVDSERSNFNIGQSKSDGVLSTASAVRYTNFKVWGSGQYTCTNTGYDGLQVANFVSFKGSGLIGTNIYSQEACGYGFRFEGQGSNEITNTNFTNLISDGDNGCACNLAGMHVFRTRNSYFNITVTKQSAGLFGTPFDALSTATSTGNQFEVTYGNLTSWVWAIQSDAVDNSFNANGSLTRQLAQNYAASWTPNPYTSRIYTITLTGNTTVLNPGKKTPGFVLQFKITQDGVGGRTVTFDTDFQATWVPNTAAGKTNIISFVSDGTTWLQTGTYVAP